MEGIVKQMLSPKRFEHSINVAILARELAENLGENAEKAYMAGIVHDIAKEKTFEEQLELCREGSIEPDEYEKSAAALLHAPAGAAMLRKYGIDDKDIINAVRYHTVGRCGMSTLEKIIYFADMIEQSRNFDGVDELRNLYRTDFEKAFIKSLELSVAYNMKRGVIVHPGTLLAWNDEIKKRKEADI